MGIYADRALLEQKSDQAFIQAINEVYFGRTAGINRVFNAYCDWREPFISKTKYFNATYKNMYNKDMEVFRNEVCKQFGFKTFSYNVIQMPVLNSFTVTEVIPTRTVSKIEITKDGYRFKKDTDINAIVSVYSDLILNPQYTNEENFAILLHEIGHNFQSAISQSLATLDAASMIFILLINVLKRPEVLVNALGNLILSSDITKKGFNTVINGVSSNQIVGSLYSVFSLIAYIGLYGVSLFRDILALPEQPLYRILRFVDSAIEYLFMCLFGRPQVDFAQERIADGFAASYGFGEALTSGLLKFEGNGISGNTLLDDAVGAIPLIGHLYSLICLPGLILCSFVDEHPIVADRAYDILNDLKQDLKDPSLSPQLKKQLEKEISNYERNMDTYFKESKKLSNANFAAVYFQEYIYNNQGSKKLKAFDLPYKNVGGLRGETNKTAADIMSGKFNNNHIAKTIIK